MKVNLGDKFLDIKITNFIEPHFIHDKYGNVRFIAIITDSIPELIDLSVKSWYEEINDYKGIDFDEIEAYISLNVMTNSEWRFGFASISIDDNYQDIDEYPEAYLDDDEKQAVKNIYEIEENNTTLRTEVYAVKRQQHGINNKQKL
ncbi:MAG: hypothetical protein PHV07_01645 [Oscillospiraceae bacterium]|nr:hypothetical protein [Oscillospiraceae bacterium]